MKKILFLLLCAYGMQAQTYQNPTFGTVTTKTSPTVTTPAFMNTQEATGVNGKIPSTYIEKTDNKQNSLTTDGTGVKYSTVDAVNTGLDLKKNATSTAITSTLTITNNTTSVTVSAFTGKIVNNSTVPATITNINFLGASNVTPSYFRTILYVDNTGVLQQFNGATSDLTPLQRVDNLFIGIVVFSGTVQAIQTLPDIEYGTDNRLAILGSYLRNINEGNNIGANGANLQVNKGAGTTWRLGSNFVTDRKVPDVTTDVAAAPIPAGVNLVAYRNGSGGWTYEAFSGSITPQFWDNGSGTKQTVSNNRYTNVRPYFFNGTNTYVFYLGRTEFTSLDLAESDAKLPPTVVDPATSVASLIGTISVAWNATALNNTTQARFTQGPRMQGGVGGGGVSGSQTLNNTYLNSSDPQFITTTGLGAVTFQAGSGLNATTVFETKNDAGTVTAGITGNGAITGLTYNGYTPESNSNKATDFTTVNNTLYPSAQAVKTELDLKANDADAVHKTGNETITTGVKSFLGKVYIGTTTAVGTENVALKSDITNTGNVVTRAGQFYSTQQGTQSFTGIDVQTDAQNSGAVDHVATNQNYTKLNNTGSLDKAWGIYHVGDKLSGAGVVNNAYGFYHAGWGGTIGKKWSFYAAADYMFLSASSGIAMNTFTPQELIDMENGNANGLGAKFNNAWAGNYNFSGAIASFGHYAMKTVNGGLAFLQLADGTTFLNSNAGKSIFLTAGLVNAARITPGSKIQIGTSVDDSTPDTGEELQVIGSVKATSYTGGATLTGTPTAPTATAGTNTTQIATTAFVQQNKNKLTGYTVATLPAGTIGDMAYVTDALGFTYNNIVVGGGTGVTIVFFDGTNWRTH